MKYAVCNEMFGKMPFPESCRLAARHGFHGLELAPFTLFEDPAGAGRAEVRRIAQGLAAAGLEFVGFHWLLASPPGLHITTADLAVRRRSWEHLRRLVDIAGQLGGGVLVLGSPRQRSAAGLPAAEAVRVLQEGLADLSPFAARHGCAVLLEALPAEATDVVNTLEEVRRLLRGVSPAGAAGMFDFHNTADETLSWEDLIGEYANLIRHVHLNERNGSYPGTGSSDYRPAFRRLREIGFERWVSLEIFHLPDDPQQVLAETMRFLRAMEPPAGEAAGRR
jgi:sugar phosphate isomerase/epimerase